MPRAGIASRSEDDAAIDAAIDVARRASAAHGPSSTDGPLVAECAGQAVTPTGALRSLADRSSAHRASRIRMLTTPAEFERCLSQPPVARSGAFALHVAGRESLTEPTGLTEREPAIDWRLGLVIPKRYEPSAVARNTIKRRWRAAFAGAHLACAAEFGAADLVVRMQSALVGKRAAPERLAALAPAKRRARLTFDPQAMLGVLAERLRKVAPR